MPHTLRFPAWDKNPQARPQKVWNDGAVNNGPNTASRLASEAGSGSVVPGNIGGTPFHQRFLNTRIPQLRGGARQAAPAPRRPLLAAAGGPQPSWTACLTPGQQTRTAVTRRIITRVRRGWLRLGEPIVRHRGRFCYVSALLPGHREPTPILRLRYQGSADRWAIGIYLASSGQYTESELPASFGPKTGTPEQGVDDTFILYAGPKSGR
jgi:hypothetical protein